MIDLQQRQTQDTAKHLRGLQYLHTVCLFGPLGREETPEPRYAETVANCFIENNSLQLFRDNQGWTWRRTGAEIQVQEDENDENLWQYWTEDLV